MPVKIDIGYVQRHYNSQLDRLNRALSYMADKTIPYDEKVKHMLLFEKQGNYMEILYSSLCEIGIMPKDIYIGFVDEQLFPEGMMSYEDIKAHDKRQNKSSIND